VSISFDLIRIILATVFAPCMDTVRQCMRAHGPSLFYEWRFLQRVSQRVSERGSALRRILPCFISRQ
jgi:hypothetical protein